MLRLAVCACASHPSDPSSETLQRDSGLEDLGELTGDGLNAHDGFWGKKPGGAPGVGGLLDPPDVSQRTAFATC